MTSLQLVRAKIFALCFFQYASTHICRQTWSLVSGQVQTEGQVDNFTSSFLSWVNFSFLFCYGWGVLIFGRYGDKINPKTFLLSGQVATAIVFGSIGLAHQYDISHRYFILCMMILNGLAQATAWPSVITIIDSWFPKKGKIILLGSIIQKLLIIGYFVACANVGNLLADIISGTIIFDTEVPVYWPIIIAGSLVMFMVVINFIFLSARPEYDKKITATEEYMKSIREEPQKEAVALTFFSVWLVPGVALYALAFGFVKAVYYILGFWLPDYLLSEGIAKHTTLIASMIDVGTIPGGIIVCMIGYYTNKRALIIVPSLWIGTLIMVGTNYLKGFATPPVLLYVLLVFLMGFFIGGVYNNIVGGIAVELGRQFKGNKKAVATVSAVIEGYGSVFASLNQLVVPYVKEYLFLYCAVLSICTGICLIPYLIKEIRFKQERASSEESIMFEEDNGIMSGIIEI